VQNSGGQSVEDLPAFTAEEMQALVLVGSPELVTHSQKMPRERNLLISK